MFSPVAVGYTTYTYNCVGGNHDKPVWIQTALSLVMFAISPLLSMLFARALIHIGSYQISVFTIPTMINGLFFLFCLVLVYFKFTDISFHNQDEHSETSPDKDTPNPNCGTWLADLKIIFSNPTAALAVGSTPVVYYFVTSGLMFVPMVTYELFHWKVAITSVLIFTSFALNAMSMLFFSYIVKTVSGIFKLSFFSISMCIISYCVYLAMKLVPLTEISKPVLMTLLILSQGFTLIGDTIVVRLLAAKRVPNDQQVLPQSLIEAGRQIIILICTPFMGEFFACFEVFCVVAIILTSAVLAAFGVRYTFEMKQILAGSVDDELERAPLRANEYTSDG